MSDGYAGEYDDLDPVEWDDFTLDFAASLITGDVIQSVVFTLEVLEGADADPSDHLTGLSDITGTKVTHRLMDCLPEVYYRLSALIVLNSGRQLVSWGHFWCRTRY